MDDRLEDIIYDIIEDYFRKSHMYATLCSDKEDSLKLFNLKAKSGWTDRSFTKLLELLKEMLIEGNNF